MWKVVVVVRGIFEHVKGPKTNVEYNFLGASKSFLMVMYVSFIHIQNHGKSLFIMRFHCFMLTEKGGKIKGKLHFWLHLFA